MSDAEGWPHEVTAGGLRLSACAPHDLLTRLGDKWTILVLSLLSIAPRHRLRFSALKYGVRGISQRMLTLTLRNLERDGLVIREYFAEVPPRVEYQLSPMGESMQGPLKIFAGWIGANWPSIEQARRVFDAEQEVARSSRPEPIRQTRSAPPGGAHPAGPHATRPPSTARAVSTR